MRNKLLFMICTAALLLLAACGGPAPSSTQPAAVGPTAAGNPPSGGGPTAASAATAAVSAGPTGPLDPALASANASAALGHVYEGLVALDSSNAEVDLLASGITPSQDSLDYVVSLRTGVQFHDGTALNADTVVANFNRWFDPKSPLHGPGTYTAWVTNFGGFKGETDSAGKPKSEFDGIEKQNETTVILHLNRLDANFVSKLA